MNFFIKIKIALWSYLFRPFAFLFDPEKSHGFALWWAGKISRRYYKSCLINLAQKNIQEISNDILDLSVNLGLMKAFNPIGLAAGLDKNIEAPFYWNKIGFGFAEMGTITPLGQEGNPLPRLFRLKKDLALINRMGFNNRGMKSISSRFQNYPNYNEVRKNFCLGINIGKNKDTPLEESFTDYVKLIDEFKNIADYFSVNISSPNTPSLRKLHEKKYLKGLLFAIKKTKIVDKVPFFLKLAPDFEAEPLVEAAKLAEKNKFSGIIMGNTTIQRETLQLKSKNFVHETGGLSGKPLKQLNLELVQKISRELPDFPIIGVGGIFSFDDMKEYLQAGAGMVQIYTGLIYKGPYLVKKIIMDLKNDMKRKKVNNFSDYLKTIR